MLSDPWAAVCSSPSLLAFWVPLCILPVYEVESLFLGFFLIYLHFTDQKKKKKKNLVASVTFKVLLLDGLQHPKLMFLYDFLKSHNLILGRAVKEISCSQPAQKMTDSPRNF